MALVDYGSDSDAEASSSAPAPAAAPAKRLPAVAPGNDAASDDDDDDAFDPQDAFGLARIPHEVEQAQQPPAADAAKATAAAAPDSAPQVIAAVSLARSIDWMAARKQKSRCSLAGLATNTARRV